MGLSPQLRRARRLLCWTLDETSARSGLAVSIIQRAEVGDGVPDITLIELARLRSIFEAAGITFGYDGTVTLAQHDTTYERST